jgi:predicted CoA-binding protein
MDHSSEFANPSDEEIKRILKRYKRVAVVGLSSDQTRASYGVARYLQQRGFNIFPVNPNETEVLGERAYPDLVSIPEPVEIVDIFRRPEHVPPIVDDAVKIGAKVIWMQLGVVNHAAARKAAQAGMTVVIDKCIYAACRDLCE